MTQEQFVLRGRPRWQELEQLLGAARRRGVTGLDLREVRRLGEPYRLAAADLAHARTFFPAADVTRYLNRVVTEAHGLVYAPAPRRGRDLLHGLIYQLPAGVRRHWRPVALAAALLAFGGVVGAVAALALPELARSWLPEHFQEFTPEPLTEDPFPLEMRPLISAAILTNNVLVGIKAFGLGLTAGVGTAWILFYNGLLLGVLAAMAHQAGWALPFWSLILPHGVLELMAIAVMGGAGLVMGGALIDPGRRTRRRALVAAAGDALRLVLVAVPMLGLAAGIEGFLTPIISLSPWLKIGLGFAVGAAVAAWLAVARPGAAGQGAAQPGGGPAQPGGGPAQPGGGPAGG